MRKALWVAVFMGAGLLAAACNPSGGAGGPTGNAGTPTPTAATATETAAASASGAITSCDAAAFAAKYPSLVGKTIRIGLDPTFPPMQYRDPANPDNYIGHEPDLAKAAMGCLGLKYTFSPGDFVGLIPALTAGQIDLEWSDLLYTTDRNKVVDYVIYLKAGQAVIVKAGNPLNIQSVDDFCGKRIALNTGTVQETIARDQSAKCTAAGKPEVQIQTYNGGPALFLAVKQGRADITMNDVVLAAQIVKENPDLANAFNLVTNDTVGAAVKKGNTDLLNAVFDAVKILQANGTQQRIEQTYGIDPTLQVPAEIRTGS